MSHHNWQENYKDHPKKKRKTRSGLKRLLHRRPELRVAVLDASVLVILAAVAIVDDEEVPRQAVGQAVEAVGRRGSAAPVATIQSGMR